MARSILAVALCLACVPAALAQRQPGDPIKLTVEPAKAPARPLKYAFSFELVAQTSGNAATDYKEAGKLFREAVSSTGTPSEQIDAWLDADLKDFAVKEVEEFFKKHPDILLLLEKAARREQCDWGHREGLRKKGINLAIPELQDMRGLVRLVALHCRLNVAKGKIDDSLQDVRLGMVMARHVAESPLLISDLVGIALTTVMLARVEEIIQQPGAPNLYSVLSALPAPYVPISKAIEGEKLGLCGTFPGLADSVGDPSAGPMTEEQVQECIKVLGDIDRGLAQNPLATVIALNVSMKHEKAKEALIAAGRPKEKVEAMPHFQVALLHAFLVLEPSYDEMLTVQKLPPWEALPKAREISAQIREKARKVDNNGPALNLIFKQFLPAYDRVMRAQIRADRRIAALRCVEAIRLYAAAHDGQLPARLSDIKDVTLPVDPLVGKPFEYQVVEKTAVLKGAIPPDEKDRKAEWLTYEVTIKKQD
jgi:hypothetical protein